MNLKKSQFSLNQKIFVVKSFFRNQENLFMVREEFHQTFLVETTESIFKSFNAILNYFESTGSVTPLVYYDEVQPDKVYYDKATGTMIVYRHGQEPLFIDPDKITSDTGQEMAAMGDGELLTPDPIEPSGDTFVHAVVEEEVYAQEDDHQDGLNNMDENLEEEQQDADLRHDDAQCDDAYSNLSLAEQLHHDPDTMDHQETVDHADLSTITNVCEVTTLIEDASVENSNEQVGNGNDEDEEIDIKPQLICTVTDKPQLDDQQQMMNPFGIPNFDILLNQQHHQMMSPPPPLGKRVVAGLGHGCIYCPKMFISNAALVTHLRTHTNERPYKCHYCDKCFKQKGARTVHHRRHTGENPFVCQICGKGYKQSVNLRSHMKSVHRDHQLTKELVAGIKAYQHDKESSKAAKS